MSMRISSAPAPLALAGLAATALAGCQQAAPVPEKADGGEHIACALAGAKGFKPVCAVERSKSGEVLTLIVRHPDGGFRRFDVRDDGRGLALADGAEKVVTHYGEGFAELSVNDDRYRFPVTVKNDAAKR